MRALTVPLSFLFRPLETCWFIKGNRNRLDYYWTALIIVVMAVVVRLVGIYLVHYPLESIRPQDASILLETAKVVLPCVTWVVACFAITAILSGESLVSEIALITVYALLPYVVLNIPIALLSYMLERNQLALYTILQDSVYAWVVVLIFVGIKEMNDYTFRKTVLVTVLSTLCVLLIWSVIVLLILMTRQLYGFLSDIYFEIRLQFR